MVKIIFITITNMTINNIITFELQRSFVLFISVYCIFLFHKLYRYFTKKYIGDISSNNNNNILLIILDSIIIIFIIAEKNYCYCKK